MSTGELIVELGTTGDAERALLGGKAATLGALAAAGSRCRRDSR